MNILLLKRNYKYIIQGRYDYINLFINNNNNNLISNILFNKIKRKYFSNNNNNNNNNKNKNQIDIILNKDDIIETFVRGGGPGGQKINKVKNCVQLKHIKTGIIVSCQEYRDLRSNRITAKKRLIEKLDVYYNGEQSKKMQKIQKIQKRKRNKKRKSRIKHQKNKINNNENDNNND